MKKKIKIGRGFFLLIINIFSKFAPAKITYANITKH